MAVVSTTWLSDSMFDNVLSSLLLSYVARYSESLIHWFSILIPARTHSAWIVGSFHPC
jgi:hypothetical protein